MVVERSKATCNLSTDCSQKKIQVQIPLGTTILMAQSQKWLVTIKIVGHHGSSATYDIKPSNTVVFKIGSSS